MDVYTGAFALDITTILGMQFTSAALLLWTLPHEVITLLTTVYINCGE